MYELMMVLVSTHALRTGEGGLPRFCERLLHFVCIAVGISAFLIYFVRCRDINLELAAILATVDAKPKRLGEGQHERLLELQLEFSTLPGRLWGWALAPATFALLCWVYQRLLYHEMLGLWDEAKGRHVASEMTDALARIGFDPASDTRGKLLELKRRGYQEVVQPLEAFIIVIFLFAMPQIVGVTESCKRHTTTEFHKGEVGEEADLPCETVADFVLAFRAIAIAMVYLLPDPKIRGEALGILHLCSKAWRRFTGKKGGGVHFPGNEVDGIALVQTDGDGRSSSFGNADGDIRRMGVMASRNLTELDFAASQQDDRATAFESETPYHRMD